MNDTAYYHTVIGIVCELYSMPLIIIGVAIVKCHIIPIAYRESDPFVLERAAVRETNSNIVLSDLEAAKVVVIRLAVGECDIIIPNCTAYSYSIFILGISERTIDKVYSVSSL